jgi:branched-chain amino acid transport system permease protein
MHVQLIANSIIVASNVALVAVGFALILWTARFFHFSHGAIYAAGPYAAGVLSSQLGMPFGVSVAVATVVCGLVGAFHEAAVYRPLRRAGWCPIHSGRLRRLSPARF